MALSFSSQMVRVLVATAVRESHREPFDENALLGLCLACQGAEEEDPAGHRQRQATAVAAPADGLIFAGAGYSQPVGPVWPE